MAGELTVRIGSLQESELDEAHRIMRLAFGTFIGLPDPMSFAGDRNFIAPRWGTKHCKALAARVEGRLIGSNLALRWGAFGFFGPLTVLPEFWDKGVAQQLLDATMRIFERWGLRQTGLFTFPHSPRHMALYQKFGYWPTYLTALMSRQPQGTAGSAQQPVLLSSLPRGQRREAMAACARLTGRIHKGLDLTAEMEAVLARRTGETLLLERRGVVDGFAVCATGAGSEGGSKTCYVKFGAARSGKGAEERFDRLLEACEAFAAARGLAVEGGVNLAREEAFRRMRRRGYQVTNQGVAMLRPHAPAFNRGDAFVIDDWR